MASLEVSWDMVIVERNILEAELALAKWIELVTCIVLCFRRISFHSSGSMGMDIFNFPCDP
jgi:hypothetical protein